MAQWGRKRERSKIEEWIKREGMCEGTRSVSTLLPFPPIRQTHTHPAPLTKLTRSPSCPLASAFQFVSSTKISPCISAADCFRRNLWFCDFDLLLMPRPPMPPLATTTESPGASSSASTLPDPFRLTTVPAGTGIFNGGAWPRPADRLLGPLVPSLGLPLAPLGASRRSRSEMWRRL